MDVIEFLVSQMIYLPMSSQPFMRKCSVYVQCVCLCLVYLIIIIIIIIPMTMFMVLWPYSNLSIAALNRHSICQKDIGSFRSENPRPTGPSAGYGSLFF